MNCPGSLAMEAPYPDSSSEFAEEGTLAHAVAAWYLANTVQARVEVTPAFTYVDHGATKQAAVSADMAREVQKYVDYVRRLAEGGELLVEQRLPFFAGNDKGVPPQHGTSDTVIIHEGERRLTVCDLKYGRGVQVYAERNEQLMLYGVAALDEFSMLYEFDRVRFVIAQPRLDHFDEWECSVEELRAFEKRALYAGVDALGLLDQPEKAPNYLVPGEKQCKFCKAKGDCPALRDQVLATVAGDFDNIIETTATPNPVIDQLKSGEIAVSIGEAERILAAAYGVAPKAVDFEPACGNVDLRDYFIVKKPTIVPAIEQATEQIGQLPEDHLAICMDAVDQIEGWCKAVRAETERRMLAGTAVPGWKLVQGKQGNRTWTSPDEVREYLKKTVRLKDEVMFDFTLISPTTAEKLHADGTIKPRQWTRLQELVCRSNGKPSVVPASDKRPALEIGKVEDDFAALDDEANDLL